MSHDRPYRGGGRRRQGGEKEKHTGRLNVLEHCTDDYDRHDRREVFESPEDKLKTAIIKLGEVVSS